MKPAQIAAPPVRASIAFAAAVPLTGLAAMPQQTVSGTIAFTLAAGAVDDAEVIVDLLANGSNAPTFTGFREWGGSAGYVNNANVRNCITFFRRLGIAYYSVMQQAGAAADAVPASAVTMTGPTSGTVSVASSNFTVAANGQIAGTVVVTPASNAGGTFTPATLSISAGTPTGTFTFTPASVGAATVSVTNNGSLANPATITYTAAAAGIAGRLGSLSNATESGSGPYTYTAGAVSYGGSPGPGGVLDRHFASGVDGTAQAVLGGYGGVGAEPILGVSTSSALQPYSSLAYALYGNRGANVYTAFVSGTNSTANGAQIAPNNGDVIRLRRTGTSLIAEVAVAASPTSFTVVQTWTGVTTGVLYVDMMVAQSATLSSLSSTGLVP